MTDFLSESAVARLGFAHVGEGVLISSRAVFVGAENISIGSMTRIDAFAFISAGPADVRIAAFCHVAANCYLSGAQGGIQIGYGSGLAPFSALYSAVEDYTGGYLTNPTIPTSLREPLVAPVILGRHVAVGSSSVVLAGRRLEQGSAVGALSLVVRDVRPFELVHGNPARRIGSRNAERLLALDADLRMTATELGIELEPA